jgi:hypothetical protein
VKYPSLRDHASLIDENVPYQGSDSNLWHERLQHVHTRKCVSRSPLITHSEMAILNSHEVTESDNSCGFVGLPDI